MRSLRLQTFAGDLGLDREVVLAQVERAQDVGAERLVARLHVRERRVEEDVRQQRQEAVAEQVPEEVRALRPAAREPRAVDDVGRAALDRLDQLRHLGRVVLHVGVLDHRDLAVEVRDRGANRGALAAVLLAQDDGAVPPVQASASAACRRSTRRRRRSPACRGRGPSTRSSTSPIGRRLVVGGTMKDTRMRRRYGRLRARATGSQRSAAIAPTMSPMTAPTSAELR